MASEREGGGQGEDVQADDGEEEEARGGRSPHGLSPTAPGKRLPDSTHPHSSRELAPFRRKTRDLPNLCNCHGCGLRFPDKGRRERLQPLESQWRIVLLCNACLRAVRSAQVCSYCFVGFEGRDGVSVSCRECACRVHVGCLPGQRGFVAPSDLDPELFTCVDCCAFFVSRIRKRSGFRDSAGAGVSDLSLEDAARNAETDDVKHVMAASTVASTNAADLAGVALDLVLPDKVPTCAAIPDGEVALQLHRAMNGSQRISRSLCPESSDYLIDDKEGLSNVNLSDKEPEPGNCNIYGGVELITENTFFDTMGTIDTKPLNVIGSSEGSLDVNLGSGQEKDESKEVMIHIKVDAAEMPAREELASSPGKIVNSTGDDNICPASCSTPGRPNTAVSRQDDKQSMPDRYMKKYFKRTPKLKDIQKNNEGSASLPVHVGQ